ncbi:MAG: hypothetical protein ABUL60_11950 [Myxococcales bacterium]
MNAPLSTNAALSICEGDAENIEIAIDEAMGCIIDQHMNLHPQARDSEEAMNVLHRLLVARVHIRAVISGEVKS